MEISGQGLQDPFSQDRRLQGPAVEQDTVRADVFPPQVTENIGPVPFQELDEVGRYGGVSRVGEAEFGDSPARFHGRRRIRIDEGEKSLKKDFLDFPLFDLRRHRSPDQAPSASHEGDGLLFRRSAENLFLGLPALVAQGLPALETEGRFPARRQFRLGQAGQGQVHVVPP